jgi:hypothetical protein
MLAGVMPVKSPPAIHREEQRHVEPHNPCMNSGRHLDVSPESKSEIHRTAQVRLTVRETPAREWLRHHRLGRQPTSCTSVYAGFTLLPAPAVCSTASLSLLSKCSRQARKVSSSVIFSHQRKSVLRRMVPLTLRARATESAMRPSRLQTTCIISQSAPRASSVPDRYTTVVGDFCSAVMDASLPRKGLALLLLRLLQLIVLLYVSLQR